MSTTIVLFLAVAWTALTPLYLWMTVTKAKEGCSWWVDGALTGAFAIGATLAWVSLFTAGG